MLVLLSCICITLLDQVTKHWIWLRYLPGERTQVIPGLFDITYVGNTGAAWGIRPGVRAARQAGASDGQVSDVHRRGAGRHLGDQDSSLHWGSLAREIRVSQA